MNFKLTTWGLAGIGSVIATAANSTLAWLFRGTTYSDVAFAMAVLSGMALFVLAACPSAWREVPAVARAGG